MKRILKFTFYFLSILYLCACQNQEQKPIAEPNPFEHISDSKVVEVLQKVFEKAGGLGRWNNLKEMHFEKHFALLDSAGNIEMDVIQRHDYFNEPKNQINISWEDKDGNPNKIVSENGEIKKLKNEEIDTSAKPESLKNTILSSTFVIGIPFKLLDKGVELSYDGIDSLRTGKKVHVIKAVYNPSTHNNHSKPDTWWHYFDENDYRQLGYMVQHDDHYSYIENLTFTKSNDFLLTETRKSYRVDSHRNILYLRADYEYSDYDLK